MKTLYGPPRRIAAINNLGEPTWIFAGPDWTITFHPVPSEELAVFWKLRRAQP